MYKCSCYCVYVCVCVYPKKRYKKSSSSSLPKTTVFRTIITKNLSFSKSRFSFCFFLLLKLKNKQNDRVQLAGTPRSLIEFTAASGVAKLPNNWILLLLLRLR